MQPTPAPVAEPRSEHLPVFVHVDEALYLMDCSPLHAAVLACDMFPRDGVDLSDILGDAFVGAVRIGQVTRVAARLNDAVFSLTAPQARKQAKVLAAEIVRIQPQFALAQAMAVALMRAADDLEAFQVRALGEALSAEAAVDALSDGLSPAAKADIRVAHAYETAKAAAAPRETRRYSIRDCSQ